jgi:FkbM family methyltransferase
MKKRGARYLKKIYFSINYLIAWMFSHFKFRGATRVLKLLFTLMPLYPLTLKHPLGFLWKLDSREALWTYLSTCEKFTTEVVIEIAPLVRTSICIGANRGWYPLVIRSINVGCEIHAFEPNSKTFSLLKGNLNLNASFVHSNNFAIGKSSSLRQIYAYENTNDGMTTLYPTDTISGSFSVLETIEVKALDEVFPGSSNLQGPILIQMDIEGAEFEALLGSAQFLKVYSPTLICEINPLLLEAAGSSCFELFCQMENLGYVIYWIDERGKIWPQKGSETCRHLEFLPSGSGSNYIFLKDSNLEKKLLSKFASKS